MMNFYAVILLSVFALSYATADAAHVESAVRFSQQGDSTPKLGKFSWSSCAKPGEDKFNLTTLVITPDPIELPGKVKVKAAFDLKKVAESPLQLEVEIHHRFGSTWFKLPCIADIGSCTYADLCDVLALIPVCPPQLVAANIPCQCPYSARTYHLPLSTFFVPIPIFPPGDYKIKGVYTQAGEPAGCLQIAVSFS